MGVHGIEPLCAGLIAHGMRADMPAALVERGTMPRQRVIIGTLETLPGVVKGADVKPPSLVIVGEVVQLHERLAWFERPPA
jgi:uroporphyrin-III C-methyltransferase/precorrin-2 dehydrogenase/sirohydrochlorin ferrochelatase